MFKVHYQSDHEELYDSLQGHMVNLLDGRLIKSAASEVFSREKLAEYAPDKDHFMMHLIAMGDQETYGPNKNGDGFPKEALEKYTPTFVSNGCLYREHRNRDPKTQGIGSVKAAAYNPEMHRVELIVHGHKEKAAGEWEKAASGKPLSFSMSCFPADTQVRLSDGTNKPIQDIMVGDEVKTHTGDVGVVSHTMSRNYHDTGVEVNAYGVSRNLIATAEHPIWVRPHKKGIHECPVCGGRYKSLASHLAQHNDVKHKAAYKDISRYCEGYKRADQLIPGDEVRIPIDKTIKGDVSADQAWLLGLYLAEGHIYEFTSKEGYNYTRLDFTLGAHEKELAEKAKTILSKYCTNKVTLFRQKGRNVLKVRLTATSHRESAEIIHKLKRWGGHLGHNKCLNQEVLQWPPDKQKLIVEGWLDGDGTWNKVNENVSGVTTSENLALHMQIALARCGLSSTISSHKRANRKRVYQVQLPFKSTSAINFCRKPSDYKSNPEVKISISHLQHQCDGAVASKTKPKVLTYVDSENGHLYARIKSVKRIFISERVYDLTVPGDHSFIANGVAVSNCRVPYDECSCCGHQAKKQADYCDHLKSGMLQYQPEFKKYAFAINDKPTFFDISVVEKPADRIAHYLDYAFPDAEDRVKAASSNLVIPGAAWAEYEGVNIPEEAQDWSATKKATLSKLINAERYFEAVSNKQAATSEAKHYFASHVAPFAFEGALGDEDIDELRNYEVNDVCHDLAKRAALLPFPEFASWVTGIPRSRVMDDKVVKMASCILPGGLGEILSNLPSGLMDMFDAGKRGCPDADPVQQIMNKAEDKFSCLTGPAKTRVIQITIKTASESRKSETNYHNKEEFAKAKALSEAYNCYKVAALNEMERIHGNAIDEIQYLLAASQNIYINN